MPRAAVVGDVPTHTPALAAGGTGTVVAYRTFTERVAVRTFGAWSAVTDLGGLVIGAPATTYAGATLHVYVRGLDSALWQRVRAADGTWSGWTWIGGLAMSSAPAAAGRTDGRVDVFARGPNDDILTCAYRPGVGWSGWSSLGGVLYTAPAAVATGSGALRLVAVGQDNAVWTRTLSGGAWSPWQSLGGRTYDAASVAVEPDGRVSVLVRGTDRAAYVKTLSGGAWSAWRSLEGVIVDGLGAAGRGGPALDIAGRGSDGAIWTRTLRAGTWTPWAQAWTPGALPALPSSLRGVNLTRIPTTAKVVALTFDGAWSAAGAAKIRATLQRENVPATFFLLGDFVRMFPITSNLLAESGFRIGNHSNTHPYFTKITDTQARAQVRTARDAIFLTTGVEPRPFFRFPYGAYDASDVPLVNGLGYAAIGWTVDTWGWKGTSGGMTTAKVVTRVLNELRPGAIVLMHVGENPDDHSTLDADALPTLIRELRARGYAFTTLDTLTR